MHVHKAWREDGWNTGMIFWNQFSDELHPNNAEAKLWSFKGPKKIDIGQVVVNTNYLTIKSMSQVMRLK